MVAILPPTLVSGISRPLQPNVIFGVQGGGLEYEGEQALLARLEAASEAWSARIPNLHLEAALPFAGWEDWDGTGALRKDHPQRWV